MGASLTQVIPTENSGEPEMAELPESWKTLESGAPAPNWVAAVDEPAGISILPWKTPNLDVQETTTLGSTLGTCPRIETT